MRESYKNHIPGSATGRLHECFDKRGASAAKRLGEKLGLTPETVRVRLYTWSAEARRAKQVKRPKRRRARAA